MIALQVGSCGPLDSWLSHLPAWQAPLRLAAWTAHRGADRWHGLRPRSWRRAGTGQPSSPRPSPVDPGVRAWHGDRAPVPVVGHDSVTCSRACNAETVANRLARSLSPYLRQHAENPVDWWEWEPAAFEEARRRNVPVLLSVGYAACHWCHVMAHESFEDEATAAYLNEHFVSIKVDREERPDVDAVYMDATTSMTGHGGWPMTCVLDHDGNPFFAGTYFPDQPRHGQPSFRQVLEALTDAWQTKPEDVQRVAGNLREHLGRATAMAAGAITEETLAQAVTLLEREYDGVNGGFGASPKFPPSMVLEFLRRRGARPMVRGHPRGDGSRRHLRPARWRLRALLRRRVLGGAALREDALRQRPAARPLCTGRRPAHRPGRPRDRRLHAARAGHGRGRVRLRPGRRQRGGRGQVLRLVTAGARRGARPGRRGLGGPRPSR